MDDEVKEASAEEEEVKEADETSAQKADTSKDEVIKKGGRTAIIIAVVATIIVATLGWYFGYKRPHDEAVASFEQAKILYSETYNNYTDAVNLYNAKVSEYVSAGDELSDTISSVQETILSGAPYDEAYLLSAQKAVADAKLKLEKVPKEKNANSKEEFTIDGLSTSKINDLTAIVGISETELKTAIDAIASDTDAMQVPDYSSDIKNLQEADKELDENIAVLNQITNPSEAFVISRLVELDVITGIEAVTEDNDPNGQLNKAGGYTATVYFTTTYLDPSVAYGATIVEKGTDGGGGIEVYETVELAEKRRNYLAAFDGGIFASGSHTVLGTMLIRTSNNLTASKQKELEQILIDKFLEYQE